MFKNLGKSNYFACFSPPVMIATFFIEMGLVVYTLTFRKLNFKVRLSVLLLICLAIFQLAEYSICESFGVHPDIWAKIGFASITFLPPLGLHLVHAIAGKKNKALLAGSYTLAIVWVCIFIFGGIMTGSVCEGNYVIFNIAEPWEGLYYVYYDALMVLAILAGIRFHNKVKKVAVKKALAWLVAGYLAFIIPSMLFSHAFVEGGLDSALPSILCGFAIILALMLSFGVLPNVAAKKR